MNMQPYHAIPNTSPGFTYISKPGLILGGIYLIFIDSLQATKSYESYIKDKIKIIQHYSRTHKRRTQETKDTHNTFTHIGKEHT